MKIIAETARAPRASVQAPNAGTRPTVPSRLATQSATIATISADHAVTVSNASALLLLRRDRRGAYVLRRA